ncbi:MAG: ABC transporter permease, partial [Tannerella sp.]|nr:ABC transporter permease [Tannerella sp.]
MMHILRALIYKDYLLLVRDRAGLCMMFAMPMLLVAIMTCLQDSTFNSINETRIPLLLLNDDRDTLGVAIERQIESSGIFAVSRTLDGRNPDRDELVRAVARGDFMIGMVIPARTTEHIRQHVRQYVENLFSGEEAPLPADSSLQVEIFLDPVTKSSFRVTLLSTLREYASRTESELMLKEITREVNRLSPVTIPAFRLSDNRVVVREEYALSGKRGIIPNSVQHNVPAWSMFAVFFIAISLSGHLIKERDDGSFARLLTMPCPYYLYLLSKVIVYMAVCLLQFAAIFMMGMYLFPLLDLPALTLDVSPALLLTGVCSALAAIGYGAAIGRIAT